MKANLVALGYDGNGHKSRVPNTLLCAHEGKKGSSS